MYKLWEGSWDVDAVVDDPQRGVYADPQKVHDINHVGERYRVEGLNLMAPSPHRVPVLAQAGGSTAGLDFASRHAELMFLSAATPAQVSTVRTSAREHGHRDEDIKFLLGMMVIVGSAEEEAQRKWRDLE